MMADVEFEIQKRRTFGIISHPDAGKTTLTEKLLLFGGAIQVAGAIKAKKSTRHAASDFMEIEKQRGISVATSVMGFHYKQYKINILDTPGHADFCEDTYRTLTAVDSAIMVIDSTKGVESQTYKLLEVCRMRKTPIMTFLNKLDREGYEPIELLDNIEEKLAIKVCPMSWPIGMGKRFKGVYHIYDQSLVLFDPHKQDLHEAVHIKGLEDPLINQYLDTHEITQLKDEVELVTGVYQPFNKTNYLSGEVTPIFFGSALNNFGVRELLNSFVKLAPAPKPRHSTIGIVSVEQKKFSGFIFKIHANIDPKHRDRIAFLRVCSGRFERNKRYFHVRSKKPYRSANPTAFMAQSKEVVEEAYPGDIIGLHDTGQLKIGDTLTEGDSFSFKGIPQFSPELFRIVKNKDPMKTKQLNKGLLQLCEEGVAQLFFRPMDNQKIVGTVGALQFEVIQYRLNHEYGAQCQFDRLNFFKACWVSSDTPGAIDTFIKSRQRQIAKDAEGRWVYLAETEWGLEREMKDFLDISFHMSSDNIV